MPTTTQVYTFEQLADVLEEIGAFETIKSFARPLRTVAFYLQSRARECFDQSRAPDGTPWAALKNPSKKRGGSSAKPLRDTDQLMASLTSRSQGNVERVDDTALEWGTNLVSAKGYPYPAVHQFGSSRVTARPFLGVSDQDEDRISRIVLEFAEKQLLGGP